MFVVMAERRQRSRDPGRQEPDPGRGADAVRPRRPERQRRRSRWSARSGRGASDAPVSRLGGPARRRAGHPDQPPVQADVARVPSRGHRHPGPRCGDRRRLADDDGRPVLGREPRPAVRDGRCGQGRRRHDPARRRLQAADQPVLLPGPGRRGPALPRRSARADGPAGHHRGDGAEPGRHRRRVRRHPPDRHPEHAELLAPAATSGGSPGRSCSSAATARRSRSG